MITFFWLSKPKEQMNIAITKFDRIVFNFKFITVVKHFKLYLIKLTCSWFQGIIIKIQNVESKGERGHLACLYSGMLDYGLTYDGRVWWNGTLISEQYRLAIACIIKLFYKLLPPWILPPERLPNLPIYQNYLEKIWWSFF